jgi:hypothetical protein
VDAIAVRATGDKQTRQADRQELRQYVYFSGKFDQTVYYLRKIASLDA